MNYRKPKKHKSMDSDEDEEEPQNEPGTSSTSQPTEPVLPCHQGPAASTQGPAVRYSSADEESEYSVQSSAPSQDSQNTQYYPDLYVLTMMSIGQLHRKHTSVQQQPDHFAR